MTAFALVSRTKSYVGSMTGLVRVAQVRYGLTQHGEQLPAIDGRHNASPTLCEQEFLTSESVTAEGGAALPIQLHVQHGWRRAS